MNRIRKILLVDDDEVTNLLHKRMIMRTELVEEIDIVTDGLAALTYLEEALAAGEALPELVFLDINMPRMGGFEFLEQYAELDVKGEVQQVIVMLSTSLLEADHDRAEADPNVKCFANKPICSGDFQDIVREFIKAQQGLADWRSVHERVSRQTRARSLLQEQHPHPPL